MTCKQSDWKTHMDEEDEIRLAQTAQIAEYVRVVLRGYAIADGNSDHVLVRLIIVFVSWPFQKLHLVVGYTG
jgi:hypothetical protein